ncbi:MAG: hypothetical protein BMS9Abin02_2085 [Anaerolineae bacterium]|nr:MAG: hypothetical protein BMS9Abin02_2085 [Anaerolineae bacterium]
MRLITDVELGDLPIMHQASIDAGYLDEMGHMNVMWYTHLFDRATWRFFASLGMDLNYYEKSSAGAFALEQHTRYLAELLQGQSVLIRTRALGRTIKRIHFMHFMVLRDTDQLAATTELIGIHIDFRTRTSSPFPEQIAKALDVTIAEHNQLSWDPPICGSMRP